MGKSLWDVVAIVAAIILVILFGAPVLFRLLWNWSVVSWLGVPAITYWQAFGVFLLWELMGAGMFAVKGKK